MYGCDRLSDGLYATAVGHRLALTMPPTNIVLFCNSVENNVDSSWTWRTNSGTHATKIGRASYSAAVNQLEFGSAIARDATSWHASLRTTIRGNHFVSCLSQQSSFGLHNKHTTTCAERSSTLHRATLSSTLLQYDKNDQLRPQKFLVFICCSYYSKTTFQQRHSTGTSIRSKGGQLKIDKQTEYHTNSLQLKIQKGLK